MFSPILVSCVTGKNKHFEKDLCHLLVTTSNYTDEGYVLSCHTSQTHSAFTVLANLWIWGSISGVARGPLIAGSCLPALFLWLLPYWSMLERFVGPMTEAGKSPGIIYSQFLARSPSELRSLVTSKAVKKSGRGKQGSGSCNFTGKYTAPNSLLSLSPH